MAKVVTNTKFFKKKGLSLTGLFFLLVFGISCNSETTTPNKDGFTDAIYSSPHKLWAHHADDVDTALRRILEYPGIEIDLQFEEKLNRFSVRHDADKEGHELFLDEFLSIVEKNGENLYYWFDFKNLNAQNLDASCNRLFEVLNEDLRKRVIVESFMASEIVELNKRGFFTSFWIPHLYADATKADTLRAISLMEEVMASKHINALSAHHMMLNFIKQHQPQANIHLWTNGLISEEDKEIIRQLINEPNVKVILVDYPKNFMN